MKVYKKVEQNIECDLDTTGATLLSIEEAEQLPIELRGYGNWWWLRSSGFGSNFDASVCNDGSVYRGGINVNYRIAAVRPALQIKNLKSSKLQIGDVFIFGGKDFQVVSDKLAFCLSDIGNHCFRADWKEKDANDYEKSDVKKYVDDWFNSVSA